MENETGMKTERVQVGLTRGEYEALNTAIEALRPYRPALDAAFRAGGVEALVLIGTYSLALVFAQIEGSAQTCAALSVLFERLITQVLGQVREKEAGGGEGEEAGNAQFRFIFPEVLVGKAEMMMPGGGSVN